MPIGFELVEPQSIHKKISQSISTGPLQFVYVPLVLAVQFITNPFPIDETGPLIMLSETEMDELIDHMNRGHAAFNIKARGAVGLVDSEDFDVIERTTVLRVVIDYLQRTRHILVGIARAYSGDYQLKYYESLESPAQRNLSPFFIEEKNPEKLSEAKLFIQRLEALLDSKELRDILKEYRRGIGKRIETSERARRNHPDHDKYVNDLTSAPFSEFHAKFVALYTAKVVDPLVGSSAHRIAKWLLSPYGYR